jgi:hypothetical protein
VYYCASAQATDHDGAVAQLVAHHTGSVGVRGSNPLRSTHNKRPGPEAFPETRAFLVALANSASCQPRATKARAAVATLSTLPRSTRREPKRSPGPVPE